MSSRTKLTRLLMLFCGGTISMHKNAESGALEIAHDSSQLFELEPRLRNLAEIVPLHIANIDSSNADARLWEKLTSAIEENFDDFDGFVITMGTNTMAYCSSALSFSLGDIGKPIAITGAQIPAEAYHTDARNNLVNAVRVAAMDLAGVFVVFGSRIILGCRAKKVSESELDAFNSFNQRPVGEIGVGTVLNADVRRRHDRPIDTMNGFDERVVCFTVIPGLDAEPLIRLMDAGYRGFVLRAYGSGDLPESMFPALIEAKRREIPIVVTTQCPGGATVMGLNDVGLKALQHGAIETFDMSMESMSTKLMWLLSQKVPYQELRRRMQESVAGECNPARSKFIRNSEL